MHEKRPSAHMVLKLTLQSIRWNVFWWILHCDRKMKYTIWLARLLHVTQMMIAWSGENKNKNIETSPSHMEISSKHSLSFCQEDEPASDKFCSIIRFSIQFILDELSVWHRLFVPSINSVVHVTLNCITGDVSRCSRYVLQFQWLRTHNKPIK